MKYIYFYFFLFFSLLVESKTLGDGIILAPNPANTYTNVISENSSKKIKSYYIYNVLGVQIIKNENLSLNTRHTIDVSKLKEGIYIVKVLFSDNSLAVSSLIKSFAQN